LLAQKKPDGSVDHLSTIVRDLSDQKRAEDRLRESEARFRTLVENAPESIVVFDVPTRRFVDCNENAVKLFGWSREELLGRSLDELNAGPAGEPSSVLEAKIKEALGGEAPVFEGIYRAAGGREFPCEVRLVRLPGGDRPLIRGSLTDITERKRSLQALEESGARFRTIVENAPEAIVVLDVESGRFVDFNEKALRLFGVSREECLRLGPAELSPPYQPGRRASRELALEKIQEAVGGRNPTFEWVHRNVRGQDFPCEVRLVRMPSEGSILVRGSVTDISERKRAEAALRESEERFRQIAETIHDVFWMSTPDLGEFLYVSPAFEEIWGRSRKELYRSPQAWSQAMHPDDGGQALRHSGGASNQGRLDLTYRIIRPDGAIRWIRERAFPIIGPAGQVYRRVGIAEDITELKEAEEALRGSRKQLEEALTHSQERVFQLEEQVRGRSRFGQFIGKSESMQEVYRRLRLAGQSNVTVLITGESGTGKELAARSIHDLGVRKQRPFIAVNCSAIPEALLESELFGHMKGSFTGAVRDKVGLFESAQGGTLFLDEVGDMAPALQVKVLRALQEREIRRVGDEKPIPVDVHLITATNKDLEALLASGAMREDFYYRIRVFEIRLPPLRERKDDVPLMVSAFIEELAAAKRKKIRGISAEAMRRLMDYPWPGNVRELRNAIEHAFVTVLGDHLRLSDFPPVIREARASGAAPVSRAPSAPGGSERRRIEEALKKSGGNRLEASRLLGVSRVTLWKRMRRLGL
jgi:PAS domain S-box-containing protein